MESIVSESSSRLSAYAGLRSDGYLVMASLLRQRPEEALLDILRNLSWDPAIPDQLDQALEALRVAACSYPINAIGDEFDRLFVGLGCGEVIPYASWYLDKKIQSMPLVHLRTDLMRLGLVKQGNSYESEDHAGALCEAMAIVSAAARDYPHATQSAFFQAHIAPWVGRFFRDLQSTESARFYRAAGLFGLSFLECESLYLKCDLAV